MVGSSAHDGGEVPFAGRTFELVSPALFEVES
jgi:hypothetical protein